MRLYQVLFFLGIVSLSTQRITKQRQQQIIKDVKDLQKALRARDDPTPPKPVLRAVHTKKSRKRDEIVRLLDELENEIRQRNNKNYQAEDDDKSQENQEREERDDVEEREERDDDEEAEQNEESEKENVEEVEGQGARDDYRVLQQYMRCGCGSVRDRRGQLRCRRCEEDHSGDMGETVQIKKRPKQRPPQKIPDDSIIKTLSKYGSRYKLNDDLEAIVIDVATVDKLAQKNKKNRAKKPNRPLKLYQKKNQVSQDKPQDEPQGKKNRLANILNVLNRLTGVNEKRVSSPKNSFKFKSHASPWNNKLDQYLPLFKATLRRNQAEDTPVPAPPLVTQVQIKTPEVLSNNTADKPRYGIPFELDIQGLSQIN